MASNIGDEEEWAKHSFSELGSAELEVEYLTTDPDTSSYRAAMRLYAGGATSVEPKHLLGMLHVSNNHRKYIKNMSELTIHMPAKFKYEKQKMQDNFSMDLAERCQAEFTQAFNKFPNDILKFKAALSYTYDAIINCYHGHHDLCHIYSFVCMKKCNTTWLQRSPFLTKDFTIKSCDESLNLVRKYAEYRLGPAILDRTKLNTNTQKVEATNRSMRRSLPKHLTFSRNFPGRAHSAAHNINNGPGIIVQSIYKLCKIVGSPIPSGTRVSRALYQEQKKTNSHKSRKKAKHFIESRSKRRQVIYKLYAEHREVVKYQKKTFYYL